MTGAKTGRWYAEIDPETGASLGFYRCGAGPSDHSPQQIPDGCTEISDEIYAQWSAGASRQALDGPNKLRPIQKRRPGIEHARAQAHRRAGRECTHELEARDNNRLMYFPHTWEFLIADVKRARLQNPSRPVEAGEYPFLDLFLADSRSADFMSAADLALSVEQGRRADALEVGQRLSQARVEISAATNQGGLDAPFPLFGG